MSLRKTVVRGRSDAYKIEPVDLTARPRGRADGRRRPRSETARAGRFLWRFVRGQRRTFVAALLLLVFEAATAVFTAYPLAYLIDHLRGDRPALDVPVLGAGLASTVAVLTIGILVLATVNSAADSWSEIFLARGGQRVGYQLRVELFRHLQRLSLAYHDRRRTGDVITRVTGDVKALEEFVTDSVSDVIGSIFLLAGVLVFLLFNSWQVTLVGVLMIPLLAYVSNHFSRRIKRAAKEQRAREGDLASTTQEMLTSIRVVQAFGRTDRAEKRFAVESSQAMDAGLETARLEAWFGWIWNVLKALAIGAVVWIGLFVVPRGTLPLGILVMCVLLIDEMFKPTRKIIKEWNKIGKLLASVERIAEVLEREPTVKDAPDAVRAPHLQGQIEFRDVSFAYRMDPEDEGTGEVSAGSEQREALSNVSFTVAPGQVVALVGHSGAGKSTIAQLLPRLYDPQKGQVLLDGNDVRRFTLESLRDQISVVMQETVLFSGSVADNISYGREGATREEIVAAAKQADAHEFIEEMPDGYDTDLSERASNLSGGQRQRIAIARALIRATPILILDEPTTGLDAESTDVVLRALRSLMHGKTTLVISHDLGLIRSSDQIVVLRSGSIEQRGTHDQLLRQGGLYAHLHAKQFDESETSRPGPEAERRTPSIPTPAAGQPTASIPSSTDEPTIAIPAPPERRTVEIPARADEPAMAMATSTVDELGTPGDAVHGLELPRTLEGISRRLGLPGLEVALNGGTMREHIQAALISEAGDVVIDRCTPGKIAYLPGQGCLVRYRLELKDRHGRTGSTLVGGRLFEDHETARAYLETKLAPLAGDVRGREELTPFDVPVAVLPALPMAIYAFPIDPELPNLIQAADRHHMLEVFRSMTPHGPLDASSLDDCRVELAHYPRRHRCVLRYELQGHRATGSARWILYGKVASAGHSATAAGLTALREQVSANGKRGHLVVPRFFGLRPELGLTLMEAIPGKQRVIDLVNARIAGGEGRASSPTLEDAIAGSARAAATLHRSGLRVDGIHSLGREIYDLGPHLESVRRLAPALATDLDRWAGEIRSFASFSPGTPVPSHGDYTPSQVLFDGDGRTGLLDLDTVCRAEPALDLGRFCAYLRLACRKAARGASSPESLGEELCDRFLDAYLEASGVPRRDRLPSRAAVYEAVSLLRITLRSWHQLKGERTSDARGLLQERMRWLDASVR